MHAGKRWKVAFGGSRDSTDERALAGLPGAVNQHDTGISESVIHGLGRVSWPDEVAVRWG
jgi:hypothetical protein